MTAEVRIGERVLYLRELKLRQAQKLKAIGADDQLVKLTPEGQIELLLDEAFLARLFGVILTDGDGQPVEVASDDLLDMRCDGIVEALNDFFSLNPKATAFLKSVMLFTLFSDLPEMAALVGKGLNSTSTSAASPAAETLPNGLR